MAQATPKRPPETDDPGSRSFTTGLQAAFRMQVRAAIEAAHADGVSVAGLDAKGECVSLEPKRSRRPTSPKRRIREAG